MVTAHDVAAYVVDWFERKYGPESDLTPLKLQKLLYYCQAHYLAWAGEPLFNEEVRAWDHGPVVPDVYHEYRTEFGKGSNIIDHAASGSVAAISPRTAEFLDEVLQVRGQYSAWRLRELSHEEAPWKDVYEEGREHVITHESMKDYFSSYVRK